MVTRQPKKPSLDDIIDEAANEVEEHCAPGKMSKPQAKDFLERVIERLQSSVEALEEEMENER
jgi:hypothetical protein